MYIILNINGLIEMKHLIILTILLCISGNIYAQGDKPKAPASKQATTAENIIATAVADARTAITLQKQSTIPGIVAEAASKLSSNTQIAQLYASIAQLTGLTKKTDEDMIQEIIKTIGVDSWYQVKSAYQRLNNFLKYQEDNKHQILTNDVASPNGA